MTILINSKPKTFERPQLHAPVIPAGSWVARKPPGCTFALPSIQATSAYKAELAAILASVTGRAMVTAKVVAGRRALSRLTNLENLEHERDSLN